LLEFQLRGPDFGRKKRKEKVNTSILALRTVRFVKTGGTKEEAGLKAVRWEETGGHMETALLSIIEPKEKKKKRKGKSQRTVLVKGISPFSIQHH